MSELKQIDDRIWVIEAEMEGFDVKSVIITGEDKCLVWDTLARPEDMAPAKEILKGKECVAVISHADWDHYWGTCALENLAQVIAHDSATARMENEFESTLAEKKKEQPGFFDQVKLVLPTETFSSGLSLYLGGINLELRHLPGHTTDTIIAFIPEKEILLMGDAAETPLPCINQDSPVQSWMDELFQWSSHPGAKTVIPAHGPVGGPEILRNNVRYLKALAKGKEPKTPLNLDKFYQSMHRDNLNNAKALFS